MLPLVLATMAAQSLLVVLAPTIVAAGRAVLERHALAGDEADPPHQWGRVLAAPDRLDEAVDLYDRHGAGSLWLDRVAADRRRLD